MYLGIDIGGTKTLIAALTNEGVIRESRKFPTPKSYPDFLKELAINVADLSTNEFIATGVAAPGVINRDKGIADSFGNLPWKEVPLERDVKRITHNPVVVENDANLAGLSEALLLKHYPCVVYVTISTGIGTGIIRNQLIDPAFADSEGGHMLLEHKGKLCSWESFASGKAIVERFGKRASEISDERIWRIIAQDIAIGLYNLIALIEPDAIVLGGGVITYYDRLEKPLLRELHAYETPLTPIPPIYKAKRPEEAVVYGCYDLAKYIYGKVR